MSNLKLPNMSYTALKNMHIPRSGKIAYATTLETHTEEPETLIVRHHGNPIAVIAPWSVTVDNCGWHTVTTANRIDRILFDNGTKFRCAIKGGRMILRNTDNGTALDFEGARTVTAVL